MKRTLKDVSMKDIRIDGGTQSREQIDPHWVSEIVDNIKNDVVYPAIKTRFDGVHHWLTDGFHRYHAYIQLGMKQVEVSYLPGSVADARRDSYGANSDHGKPRTRADKRKAVLNAIADPDIQDKTNRELALICNVSHTFVNQIKEAEEKKNKKSDVEKQQTGANTGENPNKKDEQVETFPPETQVVASSPQSGEAPDAAEIEANERALQADQAIMYELLESDDALATAHLEIKRLNLLNAQYEVRINALNSERNEAIKMVKKLQKELDKLKGKK